MDPKRTERCLSRGASRGALLRFLDLRGGALERAAKFCLSGLRVLAQAADDGLVTSFSEIGTSHTNNAPAARRLSRLLLAFAALLAALLAMAASAGAVVSGEFGLQRRAKATIKAEPLQYHGGPVLHSSDSYTIYWDPTETYRGDWKELINGYFQNVGADSGSLGNVFAVNSQYRDGEGAAANRSTFRGSYTDKDPYPETGNCTEPAEFACLSDAQVRAELKHVIELGVLPGATGPAVYYVLTPPGVTVCTDAGGNGNCSNSTGSPPNGICGYHSAINPGGANQVIYAVQPWVAGDAGRFIESDEPLTTSGVTADELACQDNKGLQEPNQLSGLNPWGNYAAGLADVIVNDLSIEQSNIVIDPLLNGWYQTTTKDEQSDMCQWVFGPETNSSPNELTHAESLSNESINGHSYFIQWAFNSSGVTSGKYFGCWQGVSMAPHFTAPNPVNAGDVVGFDGTESLFTLDANTTGLPADEPFVAPVYTWDFGDGTGLSGTGHASEFHSYRYGGEYPVTLTVTDSGGNTGTFSSTITVDGPAPPAPPAPSSPGTTTTGSSSSNDSATTTPDSGAPPPKVVATQAASSHSLASVLRSGLVVRYSVSSQVAGRFEVLLASSVAKKIGLKGPAASGLAKGTPAQIVIAKAILVTTKGGHSSYKIKFSKATAAKLRKLHKVSLMVRMVVHNPSSPVPTTVLSTVNLAH
jgi:hypothetical protein